MKRKKGIKTITVVTQDWNAMQKILDKRGQAISAVLQNFVREFLKEEEIERGKT